ncbi:MAG TPA: LppP/LprE family lipoprotein [Solirubrobacteraceae bacterium]|nr:LppP/LprE family lipoprotein [Solirubrobacteraceae bacterium]
MRPARATAKRMARAERRSGVGVRRALSKGKAAASDKGKAQAATLAVALTAGALAIAGCGESTQTVSVGGAPSAGQTTSGQTTTQSTAKTTPNTPSTTSTSTNTNTSETSTPSTTRTAQAPKFAEEEREAKKGTGGTGGTGAEGLEGALKVLREHGYEAKETTEYHPEQTLRVLIGTGAQSNDGYDKRAFFFIDGKYIGTDTSTPSAQVSVVRQSDTEVTLSYALYRPNDALCCPSGGQAKVTFQLNNGKLQPTGPIPPEQSSTGVSRQ